MTGPGEVSGQFGVGHAGLCPLFTMLAARMTETGRLANPRFVASAKWGDGEPLRSLSIAWPRMTSLEMLFGARLALALARPRA